MAKIEEKQESGTSLMFIGLAVWVVMALVLFFLPGGIRLGSQRNFGIVIGVLFLVGLLLLIRGYWLRRNSGEE
jgi:high-affinity Fe2+/Pb2+ permease